MPANALRIRGRHNALNALAALALATAAGCQLAPMLYGLREYRGEPHRVEPVAIVDDVEYFDDSKGTNVGATVAALTGLGEERSWWSILGGDGKGQDFGPLAAPVRAVRARRGADRPRCAADRRPRWPPTGVPLLHAATRCTRRWRSPRAARSPAMRCCCRPPAPASTCSTTTGIAPPCFATPCRSSPNRRGERGACDERSAKATPRAGPLRRLVRRASAPTRCRCICRCGWATPRTRPGAPVRVLGFDQALVWVTVRCWPGGW